MGCKPDFIIVGAQKCGTTYLHWGLSNCCDDIHMAECDHDRCCPFPMEMDYFVKNRKIQISEEQYLSHFKEGYLNGEKSPSYFSDSAYSSQAIYDFNPHSKIIALLRNPIDRAYSAYHHFVELYPLSKNWGKWDVTRGFMGSMDDDSFHNILYYWGLYSHRIQEYYKRFPTNQVHLIITERLRNPLTHDDEWAKLSEFLGVRSIKVPYNTNVNSRDKIRPLLEEERTILAKRYKNSVESLKDIINDELPEWSDFL